MVGLVVLCGPLSSGPAEAQVYKYKKKDGTVVYTDDLGELPPARRAYYNQRAEQAAEREARKRALLTPEQRRAAELEAQRAQIIAAELEEAQRRKRLAEIDEAIRAFRASEKKEANQLAYWLEKKSKAEAELDEALEAFRAAQKEWAALAIKPRFSMFPGQAARLAELEKALPKLEAEVDAANLYLTETLPEQARQAGLPPGWRR